MAKKTMDKSYSKFLLKELAHLLVNGGTVKEYVLAYAAIPPFKGNIRAFFIKKIGDQLHNIDFDKEIDIQAACSAIDCETREYKEIRNYEF
jgi:hypothetical protein